MTSGEALPTNPSADPNLAQNNDQGTDKRLDALLVQPTLDVSRDGSTRDPAIPAHGRSDSRPGMLEVNVASAAEVDQALEEAISVITEAATHHRVGVLVTRTGPGNYIVRAHPAVPHGLIRQQHQ